MRLSEFWIAVGQEFGDAYGRLLTQDLVLTEVGGRTAAEALSAGVDPRRVWFALCAATDVPEPRRHGVGLLPEP